ncbi:MAG: sulfite exporter TauE/SafE family protein, partial [Nitrososphaerota archaeon]
MDVVLCVFIIFIAFISGVIKTCFGVGAGIFSTPILSLILGPKNTLGLLIPIMLISDFLTLYMFRGKWDWHQIRVVFPGMIIGTIFGAYCVALASPTIIEIIIGTIAIFFSIKRIYQKEFNLNLKAWHGSLISFFAGISSSIANSGGIIITIYLASIGLIKE